MTTLISLIVAALMFWWMWSSWELFDTRNSGLRSTGVVIAIIVGVIFKTCTILLLLAYDSSWWNIAWQWLVR